MPRSSAAFLATRLLARAREAGRGGLIAIVPGEQLAEDLGRLLAGLAPDRACHALPRWDCLPYDRASPSPEVMGHRVQAIRAIADAVDTGAILVCTPEAALQRFPRPEDLSPPLRLTVGEPFAVDHVETALRSRGYTAAPAVEEVGQFALRGEVLDVFPAGPLPVRILHDGHRVTEIHGFDPLTQRRRKAAVPFVDLGAVTERTAAGAAETDPVPGAEHGLPTEYDGLATVFSLLPGAAVALHHEAAGRAEVVLRQIGEAYAARSAANRRLDGDARTALEPARLYLSEAEWADGIERRSVAFPNPEGEALPRFALEAKPAQALRAFLRAAMKDRKTRVVLAAPGRHSLDAMVNQAEHATGTEPLHVEDWAAVLAAPTGSVLALRLPAEQGFSDPETGVTLVTAVDLLGSRAVLGGSHATPVTWHGLDGTFELNDSVVHLDHGLGLLRGLEDLGNGNEAPGGETARLEYAGNTDLLAPVDDFHRLWRYSGSDEVTLDTLHGEGWAKRRGKILSEIRALAGELVSLARERDGRASPPLEPPGDAYERFCDGFGHPLTPDQAHAVGDVLADLASGRAMDRLVVGDVGFGKTEVALRAAAAAVLAGRQVAVVAPTTVLVRQHVQTFRRRFEALGIEVGHLSRLVPAAEAKAVRDELASGALRLVVGTHALCGKDVSFKDLGLLIVDEEQRFGSADKARLRALGASVHTLTLSATPIPRTLQAALVGLQDLSTIATAPARRRPIRTLVAPLDLPTIGTALAYEKARGGQSFVVVPRIADLDRFKQHLAEVAPALTVVVAHGELPPEDTDAAMVAFAEGQGDVLLATSIIESGLDVPRANTMVVVDADRFGLAQLHQLRGRVGRGHRQGLCYLMTDPARPAGEATAHRLSTLASLDRLGAGMAISAADLDARGGGDLLGEKQAGHLKLIGIGLYQHLLERALRQARGEEDGEDWTPEIHGDADGGLIPADYIPEPVVRLNLYARLARVVDAHDLDHLAEEIEDRFGPPPAPVKRLLARARLRTLCRSHAVERVDLGPKAIAFTVRPGTTPDALLAHGPERHRDALAVKGRRLVWTEGLADPDARLRLASRLLGDLH